MKKFVAIFLLCQIISNNSFAEQLIKVPGLFTHFYHHAKAHKDTDNFFLYLHKHYSEHHKKDSHPINHDDEHEDCKLPFKHCGGCCTGVHAPAIGFLQPSLSACCIYVSLSSLHFVKENDRIESQSLCSIWQPPKFA